MRPSSKGNKVFATEKKSRMRPRKGGARIERAPAFCDAAGGEENTSPRYTADQVGAGTGAAEMALRGDDDYDVTLGDEMRGHRASLGLGLKDVEEDLRIRASTILAIENGDLSGFPNHSVVPGYVRNYARYLGMDSERSYRRFRDETGFRSPNAAVAVSATGTGRGVAMNSRAGANLSDSRFAPPPAPDRIGSSVSLGAAGSAFALVALVAGLSYGGYNLLHDIQKVGVAPLPDGPEVAVASEPGLEPTIRTAMAGSAGPDVSAYGDGGVLALAAVSDLPPPDVPSRDGPIADLDPSSSSVFASVGRLDPNDPRRQATSEAVAPNEPAASASGWDDGVLLASLNAQSMTAEAASDAERLTMSARASTEALAPKSETTAVRATQEAWIRIRDGNGTVVFEGILGAGERFELPERMQDPEIRAGNAGGVYIAIGEEAFGPLGQPGQVVSDVPLSEKAVRDNFPAAGDLQPAASESAPVQRAEAAL